MSSNVRADQTRVERGEHLKQSLDFATAQGEDDDQHERSEEARQLSAGSDKGRPSGESEIASAGVGPLAAAPVKMIEMNPASAVTTCANSRMLNRQVG